MIFKSLITSTQLPIIRLIKFNQRRTIETNLIFKQFLNFKPKNNFATFNCNGCAKKIAKPQCNSCAKMLTFFEVFDIPEDYKIDPKKIQDQAKSLQKHFHPDKNTQNNQIDQEKYQNYSAYINQAKKTLLDDLQRAIYLMKLRGVDIQEDAQIYDSQFMSEIFQLQMEIDQANSVEQCKQIQERLIIVLEEVKSMFGNQYQKAKNQQCKQFLHKYIYFKRAFDRVKQKAEAVKSQSH